MKSSLWMNILSFICCLSVARVNRGGSFCMTWKKNCVCFIWLKQKVWQMKHPGCCREDLAQLVFFAVLFGRRGIVWFGGSTCHRTVCLFVYKPLVLQAGLRTALWTKSRKLGRLSKALIFSQINLEMGDRGSQFLRLIFFSSVNLGKGEIGNYIY